MNSSICKAEFGGAPSGLNEDKELAYQMLMKDSGINMAELKALQRGREKD